MFMSVVLPAPFSPSRASTSPLRRARLTSLLATTPGKTFVTFLASRTTSRRSSDITCSSLFGLVRLANCGRREGAADHTRQDHNCKHIRKHPKELRGQGDAELLGVVLQRVGGAEEQRGGPGTPGGP